MVDGFPLFVDKFKCLKVFGVLYTRYENVFEVADSDRRDDVGKRGQISRRIRWFDRITQSESEAPSACDGMVLAYLMLRASPIPLGGYLNYCERPLYKERREDFPMETQKLSVSIVYSTF